MTIGINYCMKKTNKNIELLAENINKDDGNILTSKETAYDKQI